MTACVNCGCDPPVESVGRAINRCAWLGSQLAALRDRIPQLEKQARKTPPKTLASEWEKVRQAKALLEAARQQRAAMEPEHRALRERLYGGSGSLSSDSSGAPSSAASSVAAGTLPER